MFSLDRAVWFDAHDVVAGKRTFVHTAGADPDVALIVENGEIAAAGGGHAVAVDTVHEIHNLVFGVDELIAVTHWFCLSNCLKMRFVINAIPSLA